MPGRAFGLPGRKPEPLPQSLSKNLTQISGSMICARSSSRMHKHAPFRNRCMKRLLAVSITILLMPMAAVATTNQSPPAARYTLLRLEAAPAAPSSRYQLSSETGAGAAAARFRLLEAGTAKTAGVCDSGDSLFANGFEN